MSKIIERCNYQEKNDNVKKHKTTKERLFVFYGADFDKNHTPQKEINWGTPVGKETW